MAEIEMGLKEQLMEQLAPLIERTGQGLMNAIEILEEECPKLVHEIMVYYSVTSFVVFMVGALVAVVVCICAMKRVGMKWTEDEMDRFLMGLLYTLAGIVGVVIMITNIEWVKIWLAPRLFLLEYVQKMF